MKGIMSKYTDEKKIEERIIKLLEDHKKLNQDKEQIYVGLDIAIAIIKTDQERRYYEQIQN
jgi:hypothetical protein